MARNLEVKIVGDASSFQRSLSQATKAGGGFGSKLAKFGKLAAVGIGIAGAAAGVAGVKMIGLASDAEEVESKFKIVFGKTVPRLTKQINKFSDATGASRFELQKQVADMGALLKPIIGNTRETGKMSVAVAQLATDLGSFNNVPVEEALLAIRSGLVGEAEPLRRFGVLLNAAAVEAEGLRLGLVKQGETMTEGEKVQARYSLIMKQTKLAQGDAERTAGSFSNQLKRLKNNVRDAGTSIGKFLLPVATAVVEAFNNVMPVIERFMGRLGRAKGFKVKLNVVWTGVKEAADRLMGAIRDALFGRAAASKPLKLKSGKIIDWETTPGEPGLVKSIQDGLKGANWTEIGKTVGAGISSRLRITADFLGNLLSTINSFIDEHIDEFANTGAKLALAIISKLLDPTFWAENWKLVAGIAIAVFPVTKMAGLGFKILRAIMGPLFRLIPGFSGIGGRMIAAFTSIFNRLPGVVQRVITSAISILGRLVGWVTGKLKDALDKVPGWVQSAFRLGFVLSFIAALKRVWEWLSNITSRAWNVVISVDLPDLPSWADPRNLVRPDRQAMGTSFARGGLTLVGERGPELVNMPRGAQVIPNHRLRGGGSGGSVQVLVMGGDRQAIDYLRRLLQDDGRRNGRAALA